MKICKRCNKEERVTLYYCQPCRVSENHRKKLVHRKQKAEGRCQYCGKENDRNKTTCAECSLKVSEITGKYKQAKLAKQGYYGSMEQIMKVM